MRFPPDQGAQRDESHSRLTLPKAVLLACTAVAAILGLAIFGTTQAATSTAANLALNRPATASSFESNNVSPNRAFDGRMGTRWSSKWSDPQWITVDLGQTHTISGVKLNWETAYAKAYQVQLSTDSTNWTTVYATTMGTGGTVNLATSGTARYVRMYGTQRGTDSGYALREFAVFGSETTQPAPTATPTSTAVPAGATATAVPPTPTSISSITNLALNRTATSSSNESTSLTPDLAVDDNTGTRWSSKWSDPQWIAIDLGESYTIGGVKLNWETAYAIAYQIQVSNDATNWTTIYNTTTSTGGTENLAVNGAGRYVRLYGTQRGTAWGYSLWEFAVFHNGISAQLPLSTATSTAVPPTATAAPPTATAIPPTATAVPPTPTAIPPTATALPPTATAVPPIPTAIPPTATAVPPTATATAAPPAPTSTSGTPMPIGQPGNWTLAFSDEFNGTSLDTSKWVTCYPWFNPQTGCTNEGNKELQWYMPSGVSVGNGTLKLTAQKQTVTGTNGKTYPYTSGMVSSGASLSAAPKFSYQYGFIESRFILPPGKGYWPAFWTLPNDRSWPPEIDVMEYWGSNPGRILMNIHWRASGALQQAQTWFAGDFTGSWHTLGMSWTPTSIVWYVDGVARKTFTDPAGIPAKAMYIILNLAIDGGSPPDGTTPFPGVMQVDYVRAWRQ